MSYLTKSNIAYDLNKSPHELSVEYNSCTIKYVFSSELYRTKFLDKFNDNRGKINTSLSNRFDINIQCHMLADLKLYKTIEKRGFLIFKDGDKIECQNCITLDGQMLITRNSDE